MGDGTPDEKRIDEALLRHLREIFADIDGVTQTSLFPKNRQESLVVTFETAYYPDAIETVRLELRLYTTGEFHITYIEKYLGERRLCRWDRHEQPHNSRDHFHPLPDASTTAAVDREFPSDVIIVIREEVLPWIDTRLGELWETDSA